MEYFTPNGPQMEYWNSIEGPNRNQRGQNGIFDSRRDKIEYHPKLLKIQYATKTTPEVRMFTLEDHTHVMKRHQRRPHTCITILPRPHPHSSRVWCHKALPLSSRIPLLPHIDHLLDDRYSTIHLLMSLSLDEQMQRSIGTWRQRLAWGLV
jgi:hypothetical protein